MPIPFKEYQNVWQQHWVLETLNLSFSTMTECMKWVSFLVEWQAPSKKKQKTKKQNSDTSKDSRYPSIFIILSSMDLSLVVHRLH